jgi:predicted DNA-binding transcriptional regulator AlpA
MTIDLANERLFDMAELCGRLGTNRQGVARLMKNPSFPAPLRFDPATPKSHLRWRATEVLVWIVNQQALTTLAKECTAQLRDSVSR